LSFRALWRRELCRQRVVKLSKGRNLLAVRRAPTIIGARPRETILENGMNEGIAPFLSPLTLMLGGALLAIGLLSLLDLHFFKTKTQGKIALAVGLVFVVATEAMFVTSGASGRYFEGQKIDVTDCEYQIERDFPLERRANPKLIEQKIKACMDRAGYDWSEEHEHCREARLSTNVFCYIPRAPMQRGIVAFQMRFE
jgi:hypothetical protein